MSATSDPTASSGAASVAKRARGAGAGDSTRHRVHCGRVLRGVALKAVQELLGHATIDMTMRYSHLSPHVKRDAVKLLDGPAKQTPARHMDGT